jgi:phenylalanyl-tRNA synthetase beta chain
MLVPVSWLRDHVALPAEVGTAQLDATFVRLGFEVDEVHDLAGRVTGPLVVGRVLEIEELTGFKKPIRFCQVDVGEDAPRGIVCGARNFAAGDLIVAALPGAVLPGDFAIAARTTYGHVSDGMICSERELGLGDDHHGILVLPAGTAAPGTDARPVTGLDEVVFDLNINPDRGYALSIRGLARELAYAYDLPFADPGLPGEPPVGDEPYRIVVEDPAGCDRFGARLVRGVDPAATSPAWLRRRLTLAGIRPISLPVDITNYVMVELGQPMHAWDADRLAGPLVVRRARAGERLTTLDGADRALDPEDLVIADDTGVVSLAAVMGGATTEVHEGTVTVLFEAAHWDPVSVARTSRRHKLSSEASRRYERGVDPAVGPAALRRAVDLLVSLGGGEAVPGMTDVDGTAPPAPVEIRVGLPAEVAGFPAGRLTAADEQAIYQAVGGTVDADGDRFVVIPPTWRPDLRDPADLVEEVIRLTGYDEVPTVVPSAPPGRGLTADQQRRRSVSRALAEAGYIEVQTYPFVSPDIHDAFALPADDPRRTALRLVNPLREEEPQLRTSVLASLVGTMRRNLGRGLRDVALFELGVVFRPSPGRYDPPPVLPVDHRPSDTEIAEVDGVLPRQPWRVASLTSGEWEPAGWWGAGRPAQWSDAVAAAHTVAAAAGVTLTVRADRHQPWHPGRCAALYVVAADGTERLAGHAGELHPSVCDALELPRRSCAMELELDALPPARVPRPAKLSSYPPALIDVALLVPAATPAGEVQDALAAGAGDLLESIRLFDVFTGEQVGADHKSLAYKLSFRASDRTLTAEEAVAARDAAVAEASRRVGAVLRGA